MCCLQATVNLATETALVRAALADSATDHAERLQTLGKELAEVCILLPCHAGTEAYCNTQVLLRLSLVSCLELACKFSVLKIKHAAMAFIHSRSFSAAYRHTVHRQCCGNSPR